MPICRQVLITRRAISPRFAMRILSKVIIAIGLVPEHSPLHRSFHWSVARRRERYCYHGPSIARVDDPVIPKPRSCKVRIGLSFDLSLQSHFRGVQLFFLDGQSLLG